MAQLHAICLHASQLHTLHEAVLVPSPCCFQIALIASGRCTCSFRVMGAREEGEAVW